MRRLRSSHDVSYVAETAAGAADREVLLIAQRENRLLLTEDKDFGDLVFRTRATVPGLVLLRLGQLQLSSKWERLESAIERFGEGLVGRYTVIEVSRFRSRPLGIKR